MQIIKRSLLWLLTAAVPVVIAACYGPMYQFKKAGKVVDAISKAGIKGIQVACNVGDDVVADGGAREDGGAANEDAGSGTLGVLTADDGSFEVECYGTTGTLRAKDIDGEQNGGLYKTATLEVQDDSTAATIELSK